MKGIAFGIVVVLALGGSVHAARASADWAPGFYIRGSVGITDQRQGDLNDVISADEQFFRSYGLPVTFDRFGGTPEFGGEAGYRFSESFSVGVSVMHQSSTLTNGYADASGSYNDRQETTLTEIAGNITFWPSGVPGLFMGFQAGHGSGSFEESFVLRDYSTPSNDADIHGKWTGGGAVFGLFAGYQHAVSGQAFLFGRLGYRFRDVGHFDGSATDLVSGSTYTGEYQKNSGQSVKFDFSGVHAQVGLGVGLGRER